MISDEEIERVRRELALLKEKVKRYLERKK